MVQRAGRTKRRMLEALAYVFVAVFTALEPGVVLLVLIEGAQQRKEAVLKRLPQHADLRGQKLCLRRSPSASAPQEWFRLWPRSCQSRSAPPSLLPSGIPQERRLKFHTRPGLTSVIMLTAHGVGFVIF